MSGVFTVEQEYSPRTRAQLRQAAEVLGIDEEYLRRMTRFFVACIRVDKRLGRIGATGTAGRTDGGFLVFDRTAQGCLFQ